MKRDSTEVMNKVVEKVLQFTLDNGTFGMDVVDQFHERLPETTCKMCGECCFSISFYSIEYHRIIRHLSETLNAGELRQLFFKALNSRDREIIVGTDKRLRCLFITEETSPVRRPLLINITNGKPAEDKPAKKLCSIHKVRPFPCRIFGQERNGERECEKVKSGRPVPDGYYETLLTTLAGNSEQFTVPTPSGEEIVDFFPFEFWVRRAVSGKEKAIEWFITSHYYEKYLSELKKLKSPAHN
jgi:Fe-S-cluster containining protein